MPEKPLVVSNFILGIRIILLGIVFALSFVSCDQTIESDSKTKTRTDVTVTRPVQRDIIVFQDFQGITRFMQHMQIRAQTIGIVSESFVSVNKRILVKQPLFVVKSREALLINSASKNHDLFSKIADTVFAFFPGIIDGVIVQLGDFVKEGDLLATCVSEKYMRVVVSVPIEEDVLQFQQESCEILLPDGRKIKGTIGACMPVANNSDQTVQFIVNVESVTGLSENIHVRVRVKKLEIENGIVVPEQSVYANEELTEYWVLKVIDDSLAVKVPVIPGVETDSFIQITNSILTPEDTIICTGGYALADSALVNIIQFDVYEKR